MKIHETRLPEALKQIRGSVSQIAFSRNLGIPQQTYSRYESGESEPSLGMLCKFAKHFGVSVDWMLGLTDSRGGVSLAATNHSVAANNSTVGADSKEVSRLLGIIESQQRVIEKLAGGAR